MSHLVKLNDTAGYDRSRNLQLLAVGDRTTFHLIAAEGLEVELESDTCVGLSHSLTDAAHVRHSRDLSRWEQNQVMRAITLRGRAPGRTRLHARRGGADWIEPLTIVVGGDADRRQVGRSGATRELAEELRGIRGGLRAAVLRVAEDQMNSRVSQRRGFGDYPNLTTDSDWCGAFAYWCWAQAVAARGGNNPLGNNFDVLLTPRKAIIWARANTQAGQVLRVFGPDRLPANAQTPASQYVDIGAVPPQPADIVLVWGPPHREPAGPLGWRHVSMVHSIDGNRLVTIDGNTNSPSITLNPHELNHRRRDGRYAFSFIHINV